MTILGDGATAAKASSKPRVLVVDDEGALRRGLHRVLRARFTVTLAEDGERGLEAVRSSGPFAVIVADLQMPRMDGLTMLKEVARLEPNTVRVLYSGTRDAAAVMDSILSAGLFRVLYKPAKIDEVLAAVAESVAEHERLTGRKSLT